MIIGGARSCPVPIYLIVSRTRCVCSFKLYIYRASGSHGCRVYHGWRSGATLAEVGVCRRSRTLPFTEACPCCLNGSHLAGGWRCKGTARFWTGRGWRRWWGRRPLYLESNRLCDWIKRIHPQRQRVHRLAGLYPRILRVWSPTARNLRRLQQTLNTERAFKGGFGLLVVRRFSRLTLARLAVHWRFNLTIALFPNNVYLVISHNVSTTVHTVPGRVFPGLWPRNGPRLSARQRRLTFAFFQTTQTFVLLPAFLFCALCFPSFEFLWIYGVARTGLWVRVVCWTSRTLLCVFLLSPLGSSVLEPYLQHRNFDRSE